MIRNAFVSIVMLQLGCLISLPVYADGYELGQGWRSGGIYISGYTNIELVDRFGAPAQINLDDLSLFAGDHINPLMNPFTEIELSGHTLIRQGGGAENGDLIVERFYNDVVLSEHDTLRIGKMLTPMGNWNTVHAAPLIPIITRPYTTDKGFDAYASGIGWMHEADDDLISEAQFYWQPDNELLKRPVTQTLRNFHNVVGGHVSKSYDMKDKVGASFQHGTLIESEEDYTLLGINVCKTLGRLKLESEAISAKFTGNSPKVHDAEKGIFVMANYPITPQWHGIVAGEYYQDHTVAPTSRSILLAVNYKPSNVPTVWKLEYIHQAGVSSPISSMSTGLKGSFSFLF